MAFCTTCGTDAAEKEFCSNCGAKVSPVTTASNGVYTTPGYLEPQPTNTLSIVALVTSLLGIGLAGIICGHIALSQIKRTREQGYGMALAGLIIGYVSVAAIGLFVIGLIAVATTGNFSDY
jgi:Domain of unknown function (DUF4190)